MPTDTTINDIVLIYFEGNPLSFARIEAIEPDVKRGWYHVKLLLLQIPLQVVTWILRDVYINGETFTMDGKEMRLERVVSPPDAYPDEDQDDAPPEEGPQGKIGSENGKVI
ncbi:MAG: hypothetical protein P8X55_19065, partial [Desulfosarcinaceae bacterium]